MTSKKSTNPAEIHAAHFNAVDPRRRAMARGRSYAEAERIADRYRRIIGRPRYCDCAVCADYRARMRQAIWPA